jgi:hypothetical protein
MKGILRIIPLFFLIAVPITGLGFLKSVDVMAQRPVVQCPCDFETVPKTTACWRDRFEGDPTYVIEEVTDPGACSLGNTTDITDPLIGLVTSDGVGTGFCSTVISPGSPEQCGESHSTLLTPDELKACRCELLAYVTALNDVEGISVLGGPPYTCQNVNCGQPAPAPIPTLNQWGLIAIAGILGIVGFMVIRRRKATA